MATPDPQEKAHAALDAAASGRVELPTTNPTTEQAQSSTPCGPLDSDAGKAPQPASSTTQHRAAIPPSARRPPQRRDDMPLAPSELQGIDDIVPNTPADRLVGKLEQHFQRFHPDGL